MSAEGTPAPSAAEAPPAFTERETGLIVAAMQSLKSGAPEVDYPTFMKNGNFKTLKTAQNTWGTLKKKIAAMNPNAETAEGGVATPQKKTPKKRTKKESDGEDAAADQEEGTPTKKPKTPRKKKETAEEGDGSPKKKTPAKKATPKKSAATVKEDDDKDEASVVKAEGEDSTPSTDDPVAEKEKTPAASAPDAAADDVKMGGAGGDA